MAMIDRYAGANGSDVARFLGRADDLVLAEMADLHVTQVAALARAYTRDAGFLFSNVNDVVTATPNDEISAVIILATARLVTNPAQVTREAADGYEVSGGFQGWTLAEKCVLDRYRRKAG